ILFILAIASLGVYGITLGGWASNSKYALLGGVRSSAQMISYEICLGISAIGVVLSVGANEAGLFEQLRGPPQVKRILRDLSLDLRVPLLIGVGAGVRHQTVAGRNCVEGRLPIDG